MRGGEQENSLLASMERACLEAFLADSSLVHACGPCCVDFLVNHDLGASLFQFLRVTGLQLIEARSKFASVHATWDVASLPLVERCGGRHFWRRLPKRGLGGCATMYADVWSIRRLSKPRAT